MSTVGGVLRRLALVSAFVLLGVQLVLVGGSAQAAEPGDNYPSKWKVHPGGCDVDDWGYCATWCTSWVAWALHDRNKFEMPRAIGNANVWGTWAASHGYAVNSTPAVGAVYWTSSGWGHVAWVSAVNGSSVTLQEYNGNATDFRYRSRTITATSGTRFIHFRDLALVKATAPTISGTPKVGSRLTANPGTWLSSSGYTPGASVRYAYQWLADGATISGATSTSYTPTTATSGKRISVRVTASASGYTGGSATSGATGAVAASTMTNSARPVVTGDPVVGAVLTGTRGLWTPAPDSTSFQWYADGAPIPGATAPTLTLTSAQAGAAITLRVTATKAGYASSSADSLPTAPVVGTGPVLTAPTPSISGDAVLGATLHAVPGDWGPAPVALAYQWKRDGADVTGAVGADYTLDVADVGHRLSVTLTGTKDGYPTVSRTSSSSAVVAAGTLTAPTPTITGTAQQGRTLTAVPGAWTPGTALAFQWTRAGTSISGATGATYVPTETDIGKTLSVVVTGTKPGFATLSRASASTSPVSSALGDRLAAGRRLANGEALYAPNGRYRVSQQRDGNLVVYNLSGSSPRAVWSSRTDGKGAAYVEMQGDGNLVQYTSSRRAVWASGTNGSGATYLRMQSDGNLVLYTSAGRAVWATGTDGA